jgi:hypothetical protein
MSHSPKARSSDRFTSVFLANCRDAGPKCMGRSGEGLGDGASRPPSGRLDALVRNHLACHRSRQHPCLVNFVIVYLRNGRPREWLP